ncbi:hypothetical protein KA183_01035 [bacterium]|nr:hypothetical protein [bacterium]
MNVLGFLKDKLKGKPSVEAPTKDEMVNNLIHYTCSRVCYGIKDQAGICCTIGERDWIIGPITDADRFLKDVSKKLGREFTFNEIFYSYEEGHKIFPERSTWQDPNNYPALRVVLDGKAYPCQFLSDDKKCTMQDIKPKICSDYLCDYLKASIAKLEERL